MIEKIFTTQENKIKGLLNGKFDFDIKGEWALISIYRNPDNPIIKNKYDKKILISKSCKKVMSVCFGDYTDKEYQQYMEEFRSAPKHINLITKTQACSIVKFIKKLKRYDSVKTLVIQCKAGISRSGAVGLYACRFFRLDENEFLNSGTIRPNYFVYNMLSSIYNPVQLIQNEAS